MKKLTAILHQGEPDEGGYWATCLEVPGANGQGETKEEKAAQNEKAVRELKERKARANAAKKTVGKTAAPTQAKPQAKNPKKR